MSLEQNVKAIAGKVDPALVVFKVSGQEPSGGDTGTDKPIYFANKAYRFNSADQTWAARVSPKFPNMLRTEIRAGFKAPYDENGARPYYRTEISERDRTGNTGLENWIAFDVYLLDGSKLQPFPSADPGQVMLCQLKTYPDDGSGSPLMRIEARSNCVRIAVTGNAGGAASDVVTDILLDVPIRERVWDRFIVQTIRSVDGLSGTIRVWRNGVKVVDQVAPMGHSTTQYVWSKFGLYCRDIVTAVSVIHANMLSGTNLSYLLTRPLPLPNILTTENLEANSYATNLPPQGYQWSFITENGERITERGVPVVDLVRIG